MPDYQIALVLSGGNALGAYHAGVYEALHESGIEPDWVVGASIGAITGAIIAGNRREDRLDRLRALWQPAGAGSSPASLGWMPETVRRTMSVMWTMRSAARAYLRRSAHLDPGGGPMSARDLHRFMKVLRWERRWND